MEKIKSEDLENGAKVTIIVKYLCHVTYVNRCKITINIEIVLILLGVKRIATKANNNIDVEACFT